MRVGRGVHTGKISDAVKRLAECCPEILTPAMLMESWGLTRRQADNVIGVAKRRQMIRLVARGVYEPVPA